MKKLKLILPMLAILFAIGLAFAFVNNDVKDDYYATKYILTTVGWATISVDCIELNLDCVVTFEDDPTGKHYRVYNSKNLNDPAEGNGLAIELSGPVPDPD